MDVAASPALALGVLSASLLGSVHCAAMCGGFSCLYATGGSARVALPRHAAYHLGRLTAYASLGAVAGAVGSGLDIVGEQANVQRLAGLAAGFLIIAWGVAQLAQALGVRIRAVSGSPRGSDSAARIIGRLLTRLERRSVTVRAGALGLLTALIPCGWLYAFVATATGTGSPLRGALFMALFWLGTVPALVAVAVGVQTASGPFKRRLPLASALLVITIGVFTLVGRISAGDDLALSANETNASHVH